MVSNPQRGRIQPARPYHRGQLLVVRLLINPSPLALRRVQPFWQVWRSECAQWGYGFGQRPKGSQLHSYLRRVLRPARVHWSRRHFRYYERTAPERDRKGFLDVIVRSSFHISKVTNHRGLHKLFTHYPAISRLTILSERLPVSAKASTSPSVTDSPEFLLGLVTSPTRIGSSWTPTRTSPLTEMPTIHRSQPPDRTEDPEAFGPNRHVQPGLTNWSTGMSGTHLVTVLKHPDRR
jgi:hypothetical protein